MSCDAFKKEEKEEKEVVELAKNQFLGIRRKTTTNYCQFSSGGENVKQTGGRIEIVAIIHLHSLSDCI